VGLGSGGEIVCPICVSQGRYGEQGVWGVGYGSGVEWEIGSTGELIHFELRADGAKVCTAPIRIGGRVVRTSRFTPKCVRRLHSLSTGTRCARDVPLPYLHRGRQYACALNATMHGQLTLGMDAGNNRQYKSSTRENFSIRE
jgi:hypothetical protein